MNDSEYGLQAGVFTKNIDQAFYAFENLHVGIYVWFGVCACVCHNFVLHCKTPSLLLLSLILAGGVVINDVPTVRVDNQPVRVLFCSSCMDPRNGVCVCVCSYIMSPS